jgi:hypothetical protein
VEHLDAVPGMVLLAELQTTGAEASQAPVEETAVETVTSRSEVHRMVAGKDYIPGACQLRNVVVQLES